MTKRILYDVEAFDIYLGRNAMGLPMMDKLDPPEVRFRDEVFERFYTGDKPDALPEEEQEKSMRDWAKRVHGLAEQMPDFKRLVNEVKGDVTLSAMATEEVIAKVNETERDIARRSLELDSQDAGRMIRKAIRQGTQVAQAEIAEYAESREGLEHVAIIGKAAGNQAGVHSGRNDFQTARVISQRLKTDPRLARIATLAGRLKRIAMRKAKSKVKHGADEIQDVEQGGNIARLLPSELMKLSNPATKTLLLRDLAEKRALQYRIEGCEELGRGPIVVCLDKSGSMNGQPDIWATAVALALLDKAQREKRKFALVCFDHSLVYKSPVVEPGGELPLDALYVNPHGGTSFEVACEHGLNVIEENPGKMKRADIVIITDGAGECNSMHARLQNARNVLGVKVLGIVIGDGAEVMKGWCDDAVGVTNISGMDDKAADALFAGE